jgi:hypothetical protein
MMLLAKLLNESLPVLTKLSKAEFMFEVSALNESAPVLAALVAFST